MTILYILFAILIFSFLIFVHELGHFLAAKRLGVQVNEFAICMGPRSSGGRRSRSGSGRGGGRSGFGGTAVKAFLQPLGMLLLGGQHPADPAGNHSAAPARILARHIQPRIPYGLIGRGHCKLCKAVHMPATLE